MTESNSVTLAERGCPFSCSAASSAASTCRVSREPNNAKEKKRNFLQLLLSHFSFSSKSSRSFFSASFPRLQGTSSAPAHSSNSPHSGQSYALVRLCVDARRSETQEGLRAGAPSADGFAVETIRERRERALAVWKLSTELRLPAALSSRSSSSPSPQMSLIISIQFIAAVESLKKSLRRL